jgi:hypothetical protein
MTKDSSAIEAEGNGPVERARFQEEGTDMFIDLTLKNGEKCRIHVDDELHPLPEACRDPHPEDNEDVTT